MRDRFCWMLTAAISMTLAAGGFAAQGQDAKRITGLKVLELSADLSPSIQMEPAFASSVHEYSAIVDSINVKSIGINPIAFSNQDTVTINDAEVSSARPFKADLKPGENRFAISIASANGKAVQYTVTIIQKDLSGQYKTELVQKGIWRVSDHFGFPPNQDAYLIEGSAKAVLIDTTMGKGNLVRVVRGLTSLPVEVAITHGHGDHIGQIDQFAGMVVSMSEKDKDMIPAMFDTSRFQWVKDGDKIDLGGARTLEVVEVPGHSAGSIMFLDSVGKTLAVGDAIGSGMYVWKFIPGSSSVAEYRDALKKLEARLAGFDALTFLTGHHWQGRTPLAGISGKQMVSDMKILCEKIISGEIVGSPASANLGARKINVLTASYGLAGIWYDASNIQAKK
jgi:hydroxyacylglutathione hydrolase